MSKKSRMNRNKEIQFVKDRVSVIETNVDDATGEIIAYTLDRLLSEGALDATATSFIGKKGRPGFTIRVTCSKKLVKKFAKIVVEEIGTLGIKIIDFDRWKVPRSQSTLSVIIAGRKRAVSAKIVKTKDTIRVKPEFGDVKTIAIGLKVPLRSVLEAVSQQSVRSTE